MHVYYVAVGVWKGVYAAGGKSNRGHLKESQKVMIFKEPEKEEAIMINFFVQ